jgi:predicted metalloprotease
MKWRRLRRNRNVEIRQGGGGPAIPLGGIVGIPAALIVGVVLLIANLVGEAGFEGFDDVLDRLDPAAEPAEGPPLSGTDPRGQLVDFLSFVHDDLQQYWLGVFSDAGLAYEPASLVLFDSATRSGCGLSTSDIGPHYCPIDRDIYLDLDFFRDLRSSFGAPGDFAQAYVLAHEVGHHVQNLLGVMSDVRSAQQQDPDRANELSVRVELQADCFAGVWGFSTFERDLLEEGDLEEGLRAAAAVGDDRIQERATGTTNPETWTHGSSEQRVQWFQRGFNTGDPNACDTFSTDDL